jgi:hypothetical protein
VSIRAVLLALTGILVICTFGFFNDFVLRQTYMVGTFMPMAVYGGLILFLLFLNPLLKLLGTRWLLTNRELAFMVGVILFVCFIPGRGLLHHGTATMMLPHHYEKTDTTWREAKALKMVPEKFLADISQDEDRALTGFVQGMAQGKERIGLKDIPWFAWWRPFRFWGPLLLCMVVALTGLALVVHRQWATHEQIPYPIVTFAESLLPQQGKALGGVFHQPLFWLGCLAVMAIHLNNYAVVWWPENLIPIQLRYNFTPLLKLSPTFSRGGGWGILYPKLLFTVIGFAYFLSTEVSLSMGLAPYLYAYFNGTCMGYGVRLNANFFALENIERNLYGGAYLGLGMVILYTGRRYYASVMRRCFGLPDRDRPERSAVWGARFMLVAGIAFVAQLVGAGIDWQLAVLYTFLFLLISLVLSRVVAETGAFFIHPYFYPCALLVSFLGAQSFDPATMATLYFVTVMLMVDPREVFMPFAVHAFALMDRTKVSLGKPAVVGVAAVVVGLVIATSATLYWQYNRGATSVGDGWSLNVMRWPFDNGAQLQQRLESMGRLGEGAVETPTGFARFTHAIPHQAGMVAFFSSMALVLLFTFFRMRFTWFPFHPVLFLVLGSYQSRYLGFSFLVGWLIKRSVVKYGGAHLYAKLKPLMIGLIAGEMVAGAITMVIGAIYFYVQGEPPKPFIILGA